MSHAVAWSGGKDSAHALHRARERGLAVTHLLNLYEASSGRVRFHGVRRELIRAQAEVLGLGLAQSPVGRDGFEPAFLGMLDRLSALGVEGVIFGNIHLEDVREWYETRTTGRGFDHVEPLWGGRPAELARAVPALGYRALVVSVDLERGDPSWLGRELGPGLLEAIEARADADPCGEQGEYHTFVWDGPAFRAPVAVETGEQVEMDGHRFLDLRLAGGG